MNISNYSDRVIYSDEIRFFFEDLCEAGDNFQEAGFMELSFIFEMESKPIDGWFIIIDFGEQQIMCDSGLDGGL